MVKEVVLRFEIDNNSFKDGNLLLYNKDKNYFYAITPEMFLHQQNAKIKELHKNYNDKTAHLEKRIEELEKEQREFLLDFQKSNAKLLNMVESFIKAYGGKK